MEPNETVIMNIDRYGEILKEIEKTKIERDFYKEICQDLIIALNETKKECNNLESIKEKLEENYEYYSKEIKKI